ncbi:cellulose synthase [Nonomuraea rhodomycinica]|uniref:Cellulose synthase n=1 Tax=Nonomuraea rhodomycinica TaxID=1712872 RepID=A0A7Y6IPI5_9ACTN|nr:cellulose synthase [Nonomuraea rhodomycinica]NUW41743.1 cellulose synthase [Nonomuraea rhodomycinica]
MPGQIATWFPLCVGLTAVGLVLSFLAFRRRGAAAGMRTAAWALLPLAAYLTGALQALWTIGATVVGFVTSLVFSPLVWAGVAVAGLSVVLFVASGVLRGRALSRDGEQRKGGKGGKGAKEAPAGPAQGPAVAGGRPAQTGKPAVEAPAKRKSDDDFSDIEDILRRRGIK